ncbi:WG repeat-containing protein [Bradyrhizobium sp. STM 3809]|uniref:WG repeat-containing protein n=1 Tax=Bradyrhizobium sp. STM 3809 TaxID=551936 RepID=UPI00024097EF|nr:WG repeat-containing protein [Bradyrhizobium sp. STM 3809]CCE01360.1 exported hypothetical protein [Bradyrhizobium sp. STM 3809]
MRRIVTTFLVFACAALHAGESAAQKQDRSLQLTKAGMAILRAKLDGEGQPARESPGAKYPQLTFPLGMCAFPNGLCGAVRRDGSVAVPPRYDWIGGFSDGRAAVRNGGLYGFVDEQGRETVPPRYTLVDDYRFGFARIVVDGKAGLIDRDGQVVIAPTYAHIVAIGPDRFRIWKIDPGTPRVEDEVHYSGLGRRITGKIRDDDDVDEYGTIDRAGRLIEPLGRSFDSADPSIRLVRHDQKWGLQRADGSWLIEPRFDAVDTPWGGLARFSLNGRIGFIGRSGRVVVEPIFDEAWPFRPFGSYTVVRQGQTMAVIDRAGAVSFRIDADELQDLDVHARSAAPLGWSFKRNGRWGLLDPLGRTVMPAEFDRAIQRCLDGHLIAFKDKEWSHYRADGSPLQPSAGRIVDGGCRPSPVYVAKVGDKVGLVDADARELAPAVYDALLPVGQNLWNAKRDGKWGRIATDGHWVIEPKFLYLSRDAPFAVAIVASQRGIVKPDGSWLIAPRFEAARLRDADTAFVATAGATGIIRLKDGSWAVPPRSGEMCDINYGLLSKSDGRRVLLSKAGQVLIDARVDQIELGLETGLLSFLKNGKWGAMDTAGKVVIDPVHDEMLGFSAFRGVTWARREGRWCALDRRGKVVPTIACMERHPRVSVGREVKCAVEP